jgi:4-diphosphocytidyl-2-C-methyl-D-erythritol kinase
MAELSIHAYAKINLTLEVVRRLPTGYHELRTIYQQVEMCDDLRLADSAANCISLTCDDGDLDPGPANLVWRAADLVRRRYCPRRGIRIHLCKRIPIGGGLAGGSTDAAATLLGLRQLWHLDVTDDELLQMGADLGMDVPFCILGGTALGTGRGEIVQPLPPLAPLPVVIAHPGVSSSTSEAYACLCAQQMGGGAKTEAMMAALSRGDARAVAAGLYNTFEQNLLTRFPAIGRIKQLMLENGAWNAALTGSGACMFSLAGSISEAETIAAAVRREFPHVFVTQARHSMTSP